jgi:GT2 family glycosyltransferase
LDILIPTHNRKDVLVHALSLWSRQPEIRCGEVRLVVVDDGSHDGTWDALQSVQQDNWVPYLEICRNESSCGPAAARNRGISLLEAPWVLITGDDILPPARYLKRLMSWIRDHDSGFDAVLGPVTWPRKLNATPFMQWLEGAGRMFFFNYQDLPKGRPVSGSAFYTCNVALPTERIRLSGGFDEGFPFASHEDLELGERLVGKGMRLWYEPSLLAYHWHPLTLEGAAERVRRMGASAWLYWERVPDTAPAWRIGCRKIFAWAARGEWAMAWRNRLLHQLENRTGSSRVGWMCLMHLSYWVGYARNISYSGTGSAGIAKGKDCMSSDM